MADMSDKKKQDLLEQAVAASNTAWSAQRAYFDKLANRNAARIVESAAMADAAQQENALQALHAENMLDWKHLQEKLESIYAPGAKREHAA